jgi:dipeptidyl aminopeptidase/acylaminoacyl peptidase
MGTAVFASNSRVAGLTPPTAMSMRRLVLICLWWLALACGNDPEENVPPEPTTGALELTISTTGHDLDPNGYTLAIDDGAPMAAPANGTVTHEEMSGAHVLSVTDLDENCVLQEQIPFPFTVTAGLQTKVALNVTCTFANTLAFTQGGKLYITSADSGAVPRQIGEGYWIRWSPDGSTLALVSPHRVALADAEGGNVRVLYEVPDQVGSSQFAEVAVWSPDGTSLWLSNGSVHNQSLVSLSTIRPDGLVFYDLVLQLRAPVPSWSPDGHHFVVSAQEFLISTFSAAGEVERALAPGNYPDWSPDGSRIAFEARQPSDSSIHTIAPDGTDERDLSPLSSGIPRERSPRWSPDGGELSFLVHSPDETDILINELWVMDALGGSRRRLVPQVKGYGRFVPWSRDGARLAFQLPSGQLAVIKRDGTGLTPVSPMGDAVISWDWRP